MSTQSLSTNAQTGPSRRAFLKRAAAIAVLPNIVTTPLFGANAPNNRITMGFIGMGKIARSHCQGFARKETVQIIGICDVERGRREEVAAKVEEAYAGRADMASYKGCATYNDFRELLARTDLDAVLIAVPDHWHALTAVAACEAGKDVYCEKPLAYSIYEARAIVNAVKRCGRILQTGSQQRSDSTFRFACELVRNGRLGKIHTVKVNVGGPPIDCTLPGEPTPEGLDWNFWLGPAPERPYHHDIAPPADFEGWPNWRSYRDYAGGGMTDWGAHHFDIAQWGLGMDDTGPVEIYPPQTIGNERLTYVYANGVHMTHGGARDKAGIEFEGELGWLGVNRGAYLMCEPESIKQEAIGPDEIHLYESDNHHDNWLECIRSRKEPICPAEIGCRSVTVCHLGNIAYRLGRPLKWDPAAERFVDDEEANGLLARAMRGPWRL